MNEHVGIFEGHRIPRRRAGRTAWWRAWCAASGTPPTSARRFTGPSPVDIAKSSLGHVYAGAACKKTNRAQPDVAVVGGGLAGLTAAYFLRQAGCPVTVYEASARLGGRVQTDPGALEPGVISELGGEFIDATHLDMLALAMHYDLPLIDTHGSSEASLTDAYFIGGRHYSDADVAREFADIAPLLAADAVAAGLAANVSYNRHNPHADALDRLSIAEYLDRLGVSGWLRRLIDVAYLTEYGLETGDQSALNLLTLIGTDEDADFAVFGDSDQRYKLKGGNEQIPQAIAGELGSSIRTGHRLVRLRRDANGVRLNFDTDGVSREVRADAVVLALPFTLLREVDLGDTLPPSKTQVIRELGYGQNAKLLIGTRRRVWREQGFGGDLYAALPFQTGWDGSRLRAGGRGVYTFFLGGDAGIALGRGTPEEHADRFAAQLDSVFPGVAAQRTGGAARAHWPSEPYALGSYSCYRPGQWTTLAGLQRRRVGPIFFAGEHCSAEFQGYMNGAAKTGREAAAGVLAAF